MQRETNSMLKYMDEASILSEARMMQTDCRITYILIEGCSDAVFYKVLGLASKNILFKPLNGWQRVYNTICLSQRENYSRIVGIIDRDYHGLLNDGIVENEQLFFSDENDIEMMMFFSKSFLKFLEVCADEHKVNSREDPRKEILGAASYIGALRFLSLKNKLHFDFDGFECKDFVCKERLSPNIGQLTSKITQRTRSKGTPVTIANEEIEHQIQKCVQSFDARFLCNGHDVMDILGIAMTKFFGSASSNKYSSDMLFDCLLMGYTIDEFQRSELYRKLSTWIATNAYSV